MARQPELISEHGAGQNAPIAAPPSISTTPAQVGGPSPGSRDANAANPGSESNPNQNPNGTQTGGTTPSTTPAAAPADPSADWASAFFGAMGLPPDVLKQVVGILSAHASDQTTAVLLATQYIRSTDWYSVHYPGALQGIANGTIGSEADYTTYMNQLNVLSQQYNGRPISSAEVAGYLKQGFDTNYVGKLYAGQAWVAANSQDTNYDLRNFGTGSDSGPSPSDLTALGNENAGIDSTLGQKLQNSMQNAVTRLHAIAQGTLATGNLSVGANGLQSNSLAGTNKQTPDVAA